MEFISDAELERIQSKVKKLDLAKIKYHIFLCCFQTEAKCCSYEQGVESWEFLKNRLHELKLDGEGGVQRSRTNCLRICAGGPIAVVYPDGIWYRSCTPEVLERILQEHFIQNKPVEEYIIFRNPK